MIAHSPAVCQCSSRTPPAVSLMFTPAIDFDTGNSRAVTSRDHPPSYARLFARENGYLNVGTKLLESVPGGHAESGFCASIAEFVGPGSVALRSVRALAACLPSCARALLTAKLPATVASAAEPIPRNPRRENRSLVLSFSILLTSSRTTRSKDRCDLECVSGARMPRCGQLHVMSEQHFRCQSDTHNG